MHEHPQSPLSPTRDLVLSAEVSTVELKVRGQFLVPRHDLVVEEADLVLLGVLSAFVRNVVVPHLGSNLIVFGNMLEVWVRIILLYY